MVATGSLAKWAWLSIAAAVATIALKSGAYLITGSVGLLSDAMESVVNLVAAVIALVAIRIAARPADETHHYGHGKVEYFSAGAEGLMIVVAAALIVISAVQRLLSPQPLEELGIGLAITVLATAINGAVGLLVLRAGRRHRSITLVADGKHLLTDVWTSVGVVAGVGIVALTGWLALDSLVAIAVAINILWTGGVLVRRSVHGLMDHAMPADEVDRLVATLRTVSARYPDGHVSFHALQTREAGRERFVSMHVLVPGSWTVARGHDLLEEVEACVQEALPGAQVHTHLEPAEDPRSYEDGTGGLDLSIGSPEPADGPSASPGGSTSG
jgi:cation diffusion facilitator family transporter